MSVRDVIDSRSIYISSHVQITLYKILLVLLPVGSNNVSGALVEKI